MRITFLFLVLIALSHACLSKAAAEVKSLGDLKRLHEVATCIECHSDNAQQWASSLHTKSLADPRILSSFRTFMIRSAGTVSSPDEKHRLAACFDCHAPQTADASTDLLEQISALIITAVESPNEQERNSALDDLSMLDVNCRVCHMIKGMPPEKHKPDTIYGPGWDEDEQSHKREYGFDTEGSDHFMSSAICTGCHRGGLNEPLSSSYLEFHFHILTHYRDTLKDRTCQDCHMRENGTTSHNFKQK